MSMPKIPLMFHDIYDLAPCESGFRRASSDSFKISREDFVHFMDGTERVMQQQGQSLSDVIFTFDDGGKSFVWIAEELSRRNLVGHFFIATKYIGTEGFCTKTDLQYIDKMGHIIGNHSHSHPASISRLKDTPLYEEWRQSHHFLSELLGKPIVEASIPGGHYSRSQVEVLSNLGYHVVYTSKPTLRHQSCKGVDVIGRFTVRKSNNIMGYTDYIKRKSSLRFKMLARYEMLYVAKKMLGSSFYKLRNSLKKF